MTRGVGQSIFRHDIGADSSLYDMILLSPQNFTASFDKEQGVPDAQRLLAVDFSVVKSHRARQAALAARVITDNNTAAARNVSIIGDDEKFDYSIETLPCRRLR